MTFFYKRVFPVLFLGGVLLIFLGGLIVGAAAGKAPPPLFYIMAVVIGAFVFFMLKVLVLDFVDEVLDDSDALIIRNAGAQHRVSLADIKNISYSVIISPPRVVLSLRTPGPLGAKVAFCPPVRFIPFSTSPVIDELIERIDVQRLQRTNQ